MLRIPYLLWILSVLLAESFADEYRETANEIQELTGKDRYEKYLRPNHRGPRVNVTVGMTVIHFGGVKEITEEFALDLFIWQQWKDPRLAHSLDYTVILPGKSRELIWLPDTFFLNIRSATIHDVMSENSRVAISPEGVVTYSTRVTVTAGCAMELADYPLDEQVCDLELSTYAYSVDELDYDWSQGRQNATIAVKDNHLSEYTLMKTESIKDFESYKDGTHAKLVARFWFKRRIGYALIQIYIPIIILVALSWLSFWIPQNAVPARVALGSTTILSVVTFTGSFRNSLPKVSYVKSVDVYFLVSFAFVFAAVLEYILVLLYSGYKQQRNRIHPLDLSGNDIMDQNFIKNEELHEVKVENPNATTCKRMRRDSLRPISNLKQFINYAFVWNEACFLDKASRWAFPCCYIIFNVIYWSYYELGAFAHHTAEKHG